MNLKNNDIYQGYKIIKRKYAGKDSDGKVKEIVLGEKVSDGYGTKYVTWLYNYGYCGYGKYTNDLDEATKTMNERAKEYLDYAIQFGYES